MTTKTQEDVAQLSIHNLTQTQYNELETVSPTDLYIVDLELQKNAIIMTDENGELTTNNAHVIFRQWID